MIGSQVVKALLEKEFQVIGLDRRAMDTTDIRYEHIQLELTDIVALERVFQQHTVDRVIHLAALAHTAGVADLSYDAYYQANVVCSQNIFKVASQHQVPVLLISTADVHGFERTIVTKYTEPAPVTFYGKTKYLAEQALKNQCSQYDIFRFSPVYTDEIKRDIQKRYYLKYPNWAYQIGDGLEYEFLYINVAIEALINWTSGDPTCDIYHIRDKNLISTRTCLQSEKAAGRAKHILHFPRWLIVLGFSIIYGITRKNKYTYLLNKAVYPLRSE